MKLIQYSFSLSQISLFILLSSISSVAAEGLGDRFHSTASNSVRDISPPQEVSTSAIDLLLKDTASHIAQAPVTRVTGVEVNQTNKGLEVILKTAAGGQRLVPLILPEGNRLAIDLLDATLAFGIRNGVTKTNPAPGIRSVVLNKVDESSIRLTITGSSKTPRAEIVPSRQNLVLNITPDKATGQDKLDEELDIIATGKAEEDQYNVPDATTATRTDTPLRDVPQSIQVIPRKVIDDQKVTDITDAARNVSGVTPIPDRSYGGDFYRIRGFFDNRNLRNGFRTGTSGGNSGTFTSPNNIEQVEVLKGPASVLYGQFEPGGVVNYVTKKPLDRPFHQANFTIGNYDFYEPSLDLSGFLTEDKSIAYRFNALYQNTGSFVDFASGESLSIAPVIVHKVSETTTLTYEYEYSEYDRTFDNGLPANSVIFDLPISRNLGEEGDRVNSRTNAFNFTFDHRFSDSLSLRSGFGVYSVRGSIDGFYFFGFDPETNEILGTFRDTTDFRDDVVWQTDLIAKFKTGSVEHQLLAGIELFNGVTGTQGIDSFDASLNIFNPDFSSADRSAGSELDLEESSDTVGLYLQDQITLLPNFKLLVGGRYDFANSKNDLFEVFEGEETSISDEFDNEAFSPRVGLVYQPFKPLSLYASYSRSFVPNNSRTASGEIIDPTRGTQYEVGIKGELGKLSATLAAYEITKTNILRTDPEEPDFSIPIGEVRSRGIELDVGGEILPGWNMIASTFINDAVVTEGDEFNPEGDTLNGAPTQGASLWTSYELQQGNLKGLGFGAGLFYVSDVEAQLPNEFVVPSYVRADASLFYNRDKWKVGLNFKNLFDNKYYEASRSSGGSVYPGAPFTVLGTVSVEF
jgi:iron complex outermembrane recepter protein